MKFYIVDAFANELFVGNPAGVVLIAEDREFPSDETMVKTAAELRYSETAFVQAVAGSASQSDGSTGSGSCKEFNVRYFTPVAEVDLCGHATIGAFYALFHSGILTEGETSLVHTKSGDITVVVRDGIVMMDMAEPKHITTINDVIELDRLYDILGSEYDQSLGLKPMIISTGLPDIIVPVSNEAELHNMSPDFPALSKLSETYGVTGVHAFCFDENQECHARNFAPLYEIDEEAATGTASGALTYYLCLNQKIGTHAECRFIQGEAMGRPSEIIATIDAGETCRIQVGGRAAVLAEGEINI